MNQLPPFPVDDITLDLLLQAINPWANGNPDAERSSFQEFLDWMSALGGSDIYAVEKRIEDENGDIVVMRDQFYSEGSVITALVEEIRKLRLEK